MSAISSFSLSSLYMHKYIRTPSNIDSLCSLWQAQAVCFCGLTSPLYLSVITLELSDPKTKREHVSLCQQCWLNARVYCCSSPLQPLLALTLTPSIDHPLSDDRKPHNLSVCTLCTCIYTPDSSSICISS